MKRLRALTGIVGVGLLVISVVIYLYASSSPTRHIRYSPPKYGPPSPRLPPELTITAGDPADVCPVLEVVLVILLVILVLLWLRDWKESEQASQPLLHQAKQFVRSHLSLLLSTLLILCIAAFYWWETSLIDKASQTALYGKPSEPGQPSGYIAFARLRGPTELRFGNSAEITFTMWITEGVATSPISYTVLSPYEVYTATTHLQAVNFDTDEFAMSTQSKQSLAVDKSAFWTWVVSPKEKRLGSQVLVVRADIEDAQGHQVGGAPYLSAELSVTDPIGFPAPAVYVIMAFGSLLGVSSFWGTVYKTWFTRRESHEDKEEYTRKVESLERQIQEFQAQRKGKKWWQFWKT